MVKARPRFSREHRADPRISLWTEAFFALDFLLLHSSPVYYGYCVPRGNGSGVVVIPGFLGSDAAARTMRSWLRSIGYQPYESAIGLNAQCPNLLVTQRLRRTVERAADETGRKVHLIGHSLGGMIAHSLAVQCPEHVCSVTTLGSPLRGVVTQRHVLKLASVVRTSILQEHGHKVASACYTADCDCAFSKALDRTPRKSVVRTAIYTRDDGIVDWRYCLTDDPADNFEVSGTHLGLVFNQSAYRIIAHRLHETTKPRARKVRASSARKLHA